MFRLTRPLTQSLRVRTHAHARAHKKHARAHTHTQIHRATLVFLMRVGDPVSCDDDLIWRRLVGLTAAVWK